MTCLFQFVEMQARQRFAPRRVSQDPVEPIKTADGLAAARILAVAVDVQNACCFGGEGSSERYLGT